MTVELATISELNRRAIVGVESTAERDALGIPQVGTRVHNLETGSIERWSGTAWVAIQPTDLTANVVISSQVVTTEVGNVGAGEDNLMSYVMPANTLNANGRGLRITAWGSFGATGNAKILRFYFGATGFQILSASPNNIVWMAQVTIVRQAAALHYMTFFAVFGGGAVVPTMSQIANASDATAPITIKFTGEGVANNDITQRSMLVELLKL
jgi:hypothetical protein